LTVLIFMLKNSLNTYTDKKLIKLVKNGDSVAFEEVCRRYENIFYKVCQRYVGALSVCGIHLQDIFDEKNYIIFHCIKTFKPSKKTKLSTWIGNYARYLCLNSINSKRFIIPNWDEDIIKHMDEMQVINPDVTFDQEDYNYILNIISQLRDKRVEEIFKYRYFGDKKMIWSRIAKNMKISTQTAINLHNKGIRILRKKVKSPCISDVV
jgi:RNA polymerase sigma factor (sigma-70 family)